MIIPESPPPPVWPEQSPPPQIWPEQDPPPPIVEVGFAVVLPEGFGVDVFIQPQITETLMLPAGGQQGPAGPRQIYRQASEPLPIPGYDLLWLENGSLGDPLRARPYIIPG